MCGFIGGNIFESPDDVKTGMVSMMHRGVDGNNLFTYPNNFYLGHNRLSIQDVGEQSDQPLVSSDGRYHLVFNGELWQKSFQKFDKQLRQKYNFTTSNSDTELLLYYLIDNLDRIGDALNELDGMFCFALYDTETDSVILGRDFIGRLPMYYYHDGIRIGFSSEVKGLQVSLDIPYYDMQRGTKFDASYKDKQLIEVVKPGTYIEYNSIGVLKEHQYFNFKPKPFQLDHPTAYYPWSEEEFNVYNSDDKGIDYYSKGFRRLLDESVENELISDVPICTILSGGIDSTVITYLLSQKVENLEAFVVNVNQKNQNRKKDDLHYARIAAKEFGIKLHEVNVDKSDIEDRIEESIWACETHKWTQVSPSVAQLFLAEEIQKQGYKVVFGGEGSDEIFASYGQVRRFCWPNPYHYHQRRVNLLNKLHETNLIRTNKAMMYGGTVELRTPFLGKNVVDFGLRIHTDYRDNDRGDGNLMKWVLRKAFEGDISEELLMRPKKTFQVGAHTAYLKKDKERLTKIYEKLFVENEIPKSFMERQGRPNRDDIKEVSWP